MSRIITAGFLSLLVVVAGCKDPIATEADDGLTVSGSLEYRNREAVPDSTRVIVAWMVSATSPDYSYVYGEGSLASDGTSFQLRLDEPPPSAALNHADEEFAVGVGVIILTDSGGIGVGDDLSDMPAEALLGAAGQYAVIYVDGEPGDGDDAAWLSEFEQGYSVGKGIEQPGTFDGFEPVDPSSVRITVDDLDAIEFVNWT